MKYSQTTVILLMVLFTFSSRLFARPASNQPPVPQFQSPVEFFRQLLEATPETRVVMLKDHSDQKRRVIEAKIQEYKILPPPVREWRLKATEIRYYLLPLMKRQPDSRGEMINMVPEEDRPLVQLRLSQWDALPSAEREAMLNSQIALRYLARPPMPALPSTAGTPDPKFQHFQTTVTNWRKLSKDEQNAITRQFNSFFTLNETEKQKTIAAFTGEEQQRLRGTLASFEGLSEAQRRQCLAALSRITEMSSEERARFVSNVARWKSLSERDRQQWRTMVAKVPPMPPNSGMIE